MARRFNNNRPANFRAPWTRDDENKLFSLAEKGTPYGDIATKLGRSERAVKMRVMNYAKRELGRSDKNEVLEKYHLDGDEFAIYLEQGKLPADTTHTRPNMGEQLEAINLKLNLIMTHLGLTLPDANSSSNSNSNKQTREPRKTDKAQSPPPPQKRTQTTKPVKSAQKTKASEADPDMTLLRKIVDMVNSDFFLLEEGEKFPSSQEWEDREAQDYTNTVYGYALELFETNKKSRSPCDEESCESKGTRSLTYKGKRHVFCEDCLHDSPAETALDELMEDIDNYYEKNIPSSKSKAKRK